MAVNSCAVVYSIHNNIKDSKKTKVGAAVNMKKLLKCLKRFFAVGKKPATVTNDGCIYTCPTEEEYQNQLNELLEAQEALLY